MRAQDGRSRRSVLQLRRSQSGAPPTRADMIMQAMNPQGLDLDLEPLPGSKQIMDDIDRMSFGVRGLVREFGYTIVRAMLDEADGPCDLRELRRTLEERQRRRQEDLANANYNFTFDKRRAGARR